MTIQYIQAKIRQFQKRFNALKKSTRECLERLQVPVKRVADALTSLSPDDVDEHKHFLESHLRAIYQALDHSELFGTMNFHWNYQNPQLLDYLIREFGLEGVKGEMKTYKEDLQQFRKKTPLKLFCQSQKKKHIKLPPDFHEVVAEFDWPDDVTLEVVEKFRQEYADHYSLRECAMMLNKMPPGVVSRPTNSQASSTPSPGEMNGAEQLISTVEFEATYFPDPHDSSPEITTPTGIYTAITYYESFIHVSYVIPQ